MAIQAKKYIHETAGISISRYAQNNTPSMGINEKLRMKVNTDSTPASITKIRNRSS